MKLFISFTLFFNLMLFADDRVVASELLSWERFSNHEEAPKWFRDAKFGIYFHWGAIFSPCVWE